MNITQILQIADWSIKNTGTSFLQTLSVIPGQIKFVNLGNIIAHFNKNTDEVLTITVRNGDHITIYANNLSISEVKRVYNLIDEATVSSSVIDFIDEDSMIAMINKIYNREPDEFINVNIKPESLALLDNLADEAGLTRNGYLVKMIMQQISDPDTLLSA